MKRLIASICALIPVVPMTAEAQADPSFPVTQDGISIGAFVELPSWDRHHGMPVVGEKPLHDNAYRVTENEIGYGGGISVRSATLRWSPPSLQYRFDLGYHHSSMAFYADSGGKVLLSDPTKIIETGMRDRTAFDLDMISLGAMVGGGFYFEGGRPAGSDLPAASLREHGVVLLGGLGFTWRTGSQAVRTLGLLPDEAGTLENPRGYPITNDGRTITIYDDDVPDLNRLGLSLRGGVAVELTLASNLMTSIGALYEYELLPIAGDEWRMHRLAITAAIYLLVGL